MKEKILISIITPFYNGNKYMKQLFSILENNYITMKNIFPSVNIELIIVNDSPSVPVDLKDISVDFAYRIINHENNFGIHQARVTGLNICEGEYVLFLDQDDELLDNALASQLEFITRENADMVICNAYMERKDGSSYLSYRTKSDFVRITDLQFYLKSHNVIKSPGQCLIKRKNIPLEWTEYIMKKNGSDDLFLWILMLEKSSKFVLNKNALYIHKYTGENLSESEEKMTISSLEIAEFLSKIAYIPKQDVILLKRAREFSLEMKNESFTGKSYSVLKNLDLFLYLAFNKIKRIIY